MLHGVAAERRGEVSRPLVIGLVNSMPGEALGHTERQFRDILSAACGQATPRLRFFTLDDVSRAGPRYDDVAALATAEVDGLIVTGMPPRAASLRDEPYWDKLAALVDFAMEHAIPTVWSCLAAHAAVLHLDGIERQRLPEKLSGLVACTRAETDHALLAGLPERWWMPHSRYNELPTEALRRAGYRLLSHGADAGADAGADLFARDDAPFLFCQGHPEYDAAALLREYRRDIRQFLAGERDSYPAAPRDYLSDAVAPQLAAFHRQALRDRTPDTIAAFPMDACLADLTHSWRDLAIGIYANWLGLVAERQAARPPMATTAAAAWGRPRAGWARPAVRVPAAGTRGVA